MHPSRLRKFHLNRARLGLGLGLGLLATVLAAVLYLFPPDEVPYYPRCLLHATTGLQCPGCGGLRAAHHLLHGDWRTALALNPLLFVLGVMLLILASVEGWARLTGRRGVAMPLRGIWPWLLLAVIVLFGIGRNVVPLLF